jgi:homoserine dehydrogenase
MNEVRIWVVGLGTVGQWLLREIKAQASTFAEKYGFTPKDVGVANARDGSYTTRTASTRIPFSKTDWFHSTRHWWSGEVIIERGFRG